MNTINDQSRVTEQAAQWFSALLDGSERRKEFFTWLEESPRHVEEFLGVLADAQDLALITDEQRAAIEELSRDLKTDAPPTSNVVPMSHRALASYESGVEEHRPLMRGFFGTRGSPRLRVGVAVAASLLLAVAAAAWWLTGPGAWRTYSTEIGEQRSVELADGSVIHLNTDSAMDVRLTDGSRRVRLIRGEALFSVEHGASRPFLVESANAVIQAIGTSFDVYRRDRGTRVAVIEGLVQISRETNRAPTSPDTLDIKTRPGSLLAAGEGAEISAHGEVSQRNAVDTAKAVAWRQRRLVFEENTLADIAEEFNRYNADIKIRVLGKAAVNQHFSGTFDADEPEAIVQVLALDPTLTIEHIGKEIMIRARESTE